jgi:PAS domain S-box-containing protein
MTFPKPQSARRSILFAQASSMAVTLIGCLVMAGWMLGVGWLKSVLPGYVSMKANTAAGLLLSGAALTLFSLEKRTKSTRFWTMLAGALVVTLGVLTLSEYLGGWNLGIDQWLFRDDPNLRDDPNIVGASEPGRMSPATAFCLVMTGIALLVSAREIPAGLRLPMLAAFGAALIVVGGLAFACYVSDASLHSRWWKYAGMAFHTSAAFILLGCALLALVKSEGGMTWALERAVTTGFIIGVAMMVITSGVSYNLTNRLLETSTWVSHTQEVLKKTQEVMSGMADLESGQRGYIILGDERLLEGRKRAETAVGEGLAELRRLTADNAHQQRRLDQLEPLIARRVQFGDQTITARTQQGFSAAEEMLATGTGIQLSDDIHLLLNEMLTEEYELLEKRQHDSNAAATSTFLLLPLGVLFSLTVLAVGLFFLNAGVGERAQAESALQQSEARMAGIVTSAMDAIISIDETQRILLFNTAAEKMFRLPAADVMGQSLDRLIPQRFRGQNHQHVEGFGKTGVTSRSMRSLGALVGLRADGEEFPIEASISQVKVAGQQIYTVILRDITERKRADEAAALLTAIVGSSSDAIVGKDLDGKVTSWNAGAERMFGYTAGEIIGRSITQLIPADRQDDEGKILARIKRGESVGHFETVRVKKDGGLIDVSVAVSPIRNSSGEIVGASKVARDVTDQKRAAKALRESEERFRTMANSIPQLAWIARADGHVYWYNQRWYEYTGATPEGMEGWKWQSVHDPRVLPEVMENWTRAIDSGEPFEMEFPLRGADGEFRAFLTRVHPLKDSEGRVVSWFGTNTDVQSLKQAQTALRESEERLRLVTDNARVGLVMVNRERRYTFANAAYADILGLPSPDIIDQRVADVLAPIYEEQIRPRLDRAFAGERVTYELRKAAAGGDRYYAVKYEPTKVSEEVALVVVVITDVTERKEAEDELASSRAQLQAIFDYAPDGILIADPRSYYLDANASICRMLGYAREELIGLHASDIVLQSEVPHIGEALSVIEARADYQREWQFRRKDGTVFAAEVIATMMPDGNLLGMVRDITERKHADATLREAEKEKQLAFEASRLKSEFLANMSHELRTPLNCIIGFTEFLADEKPGPLNSKQKEYLTDVYNSSKHLLQLINDVLDLAKVEAGKIELHLESFPLAKAIEEVCAVVKGIAQKKGVSVGWKVASELGNATLDQQKFKQVCYNLMSNAVKFTNPGGSVEITALAREDEQFEMRVKDTGIGIKQEDLHRLFREFEQLDSGADRRFEGTGLGLALTKKLVESHGGSIGVESEYGSGSTFFAVLPHHRSGGKGT